LIAQIDTENPGLTARFFNHLFDRFQVLKVSCQQNDLCASTCQHSSAGFSNPARGSCNDDGAARNFHVKTSLSVKYLRLEPYHL
jgi:hypothetical protein